MAGQLPPGEAAISRFVEPATRAAAVEDPRLAAHLPQRCVHNTGVLRVKRNVDGAGVLVLVEDLLPGLATVRGAEEAALGVGAPGVSECGNQYHVGIVWINDDPP